MSTKPNTTSDVTSSTTSIQAAFRGRVDLSRYDDRVDLDYVHSVSCKSPTYRQPQPFRRSEDEVDRLHRYNMMMGRVPNGYIFV